MADVNKNWRFVHYEDWLVRKLAILLLLCGTVQAQPWANLISSSRAIDWRNAGAGAIPTGRTVCTTTACTTLAGGSVTWGSTGTVQAAINSASSGQIVSIPAGTFTGLSGNVTLKAGVTLTGAGANLTILTFTSGGGTNSGSGVGCYHGGFLCMGADTTSGYQYTHNGGGTNYGAWTAASYAQGANQISITLGGGIAPAVGDLMVLYQTDQTSSSTIWNCGSSLGIYSNVYTCSDEGQPSQNGPGSPSAQQSWSTQTQTVTVTACTATSGTCASGLGPYTVTFSPGLYSPIWSSGSAPGAYWSTAPVITGAVAENMTLDATAATDSAANQSNSTMVSFNWTSNAFLLGMRILNTANPPYRNSVWLTQSSHNTIESNYIYGANGTDLSYGVEQGFETSDNLTDNNIAQHVASPWMNNGCAGCVYANNYAVDDYYITSPNYQQSDMYANHQGTSYFSLFEQNVGMKLVGDDIHGSSWMATYYRNRGAGLDGPFKDQSTMVSDQEAFQRDYNCIGNVLGTPVYHNNYQAVPANGTDNSLCSTDVTHRSIWVLGVFGADGCYGSGHGVNNDYVNVPAQLYRWANYDVKNAATQFNTAEVPSGLASYPQPNPTVCTASSLTTCPNSLFYSAQPAWYGVTGQAAIPWPAIGPDVTGGNVPNLGGYVNQIPAQVNFNTSAYDTNYTSGNQATITSITNNGFTPPCLTSTIVTAFVQCYTATLSATAPSSFTQYQSFWITGNTQGFNGLEQIATVSGSTITFAGPAGVSNCSSSCGTATVNAIHVFNQNVYATPGPAGTPIFTPPGGSYTVSQSVGIATSSGPVICYTTAVPPATPALPATNGGSGCTSGTLYTSAVPVSTSTTIAAVAGGTGYTDSAEATATYTITAAAQPGLIFQGNIKLVGNVIAVQTPATSGCQSQFQSGTSGFPNFGGARVDSCISQIGFIPVLWNSLTSDNGYTGAGLCAQNNFGQTVCRLTDANTASTTGIPQLNNYSGGDTDEHWGCASFTAGVCTLDGLILWGGNSQSHTYLAKFNPSNFSPGTVTSPFSQLCNGACTTSSMISLPSKAVAASQQTANLVYAFNSTTNCPGLNPSSGQSGPCAIQSYNFSSCYSSPSTCTLPSATTVYDFAASGNCLGASTWASPSVGQSLNNSWNGVMRVSSDDTLFTMGLSNYQGYAGNKGGQGTGTLVATYKVGSGCRVWNTGNLAYTGTLPLGPNGATGTVNVSGTTVTATGSLTFPTGSQFVGLPIQLWNAAGQGTVNNAGISPCPVGGFSGSGSCLQQTGGSTFYCASYPCSSSPTFGPGTITINNILYTIDQIYSTTVLSVTGVPTNGIISYWATGKLYQVSSVTDSTHLVLSSSPGTLSGIPFTSGIPPNWIAGEYGPVGTPVMIGCGGSAAPGTCAGGPDQFVIHDAQTFNSSHLMVISSDICLGGTCTGTTLPTKSNNDQPYVWDVATLNSLSEGGGETGGSSGHAAYGFGAIVHGVSPKPQVSLFPVYSQSADSLAPYEYDYAMLLSSNPLITPGPGASTLDVHMSWNLDYGPADTAPMILTNTSYAASLVTTAATLNSPNNGCIIPATGWTTNTPNCGTLNPFTGPAVNEVMMYQTSPVPGSSSSANTCALWNGGAFVPANNSNYKPPTNTQSCSPFNVGRVGNSGITAVNPSFNAQNATLDWSQTGNYYTVTTDWWGTFGIDPSVGGSNLIVGGNTWAASHAYNAGDVITPEIPASSNLNNYTYTANAAGTSKSTHTISWSASNICDDGSAPPCLSGVIQWNYIGSQNARYDVVVGGIIP